MQSIQEIKKPKKQVKLPYENKPLALKGRELMTLSQQIVSKMTKDYRHQLGGGFLNQVAEIGYAIYDALDEMGFTEKKLDKVRKILFFIHRAILISRVMKDLNQISTEKFEKFIIDIISINTQVKNWIHFIEEETKKNESKS